MLERPKKSEMFGRITDLDVPPLEYYKLVGDFNVLIQNELSEELAKSANNLGTAVTLVTLGSDARLEKGSFMSPLEVIAIVNEDVDLEVYKKALTKIISDVSPTAIAEVIEMKGPNSSLITAYNNSYQPGRMADSRPIYGSTEIVKDAKVKLGQEIIDLRSAKMHNITTLKRNARKVVERGRNTFAGIDAIHFDLKSGTVFFNPEAYQLSFKVGPLRFVQNTLLVEEVKHTRRQNDPNFISTLESNIVNRLSQFSDDRMTNLTRASTKEIAEHYAFFLRLYHRSEKAYERGKQIAVQLTPTETEEVAKRLQALSVLMEKFKIQKQAR